MKSLNISGFFAVEEGKLEAKGKILLLLYPHPIKPNRGLTG
jgi:hypothetical protein